LGRDRGKEPRRACRGRRRALATELKGEEAKRETKEETEVTHGEVGRPAVIMQQG
jgi:hypothetical protein